MCVGVAVALLTISVGTVVGLRFGTGYGLGAAAGICGLLAAFCGYVLFSRPVVEVTDEPADEPDDTDVRE